MIPARILVTTSGMTFCSLKKKKKSDLLRGNILGGFSIIDEALCVCVRRGHPGFLLESILHQWYQCFGKTSDCKFKNAEFSKVSVRK